MLLQRIKIVNFLIYEKVDLDLSKVKLASIIGQHLSDRRRSNGAGKTALLEAIRYALYDQTRSKMKLGVVRHGAKTSTVDLELLLGDKRIRVQRNRNSDGASTVKLWVNGKESGDKAKVVNEAIENLIGLDVDLFDKIYFFKQGDQFGFTEASPSDRKAALAKVFRMDAVARCYDIAKSKRDEAELNLAKAKSAVETIESQLKPLPIYDDLLSSEFEVSAELATAMQLCDDYQAVANENIVSRSTIEQNLSSFNDEVANDQQVVINAQNKIDTINDEIIKLQQSLQSNQSSMGQQEIIIKNIEESIKLHKAKPNDVMALQRKLSEIESEVNDLNAKYYSSAGELERVAGTNVDELAGNNCPTCHQFVTADHVEHIRRHTLGEVARLEGECTKLRDTLNMKKVAYTAAGKAITAAESYNRMVADIDQQREIYNMQKSLCENIENTLDDKIAQRNVLFIDQSQAMQRTNSSMIELFRSQLRLAIEKCYQIFNVIGVNRTSQLRQSVYTLTTSHANILSLIKQRKNLDASLATAKEQLNKAAIDLAVNTYLTDAFSKNGIQALMIENAIGTIETFANEILRQMHTNFIISMRTQKETKAGDMRESLDIVVYDNGFEKPFESYSGGERTLINIAIRLSLSRVVSSFHGVRMQSLFLDEVLGALDSVNREEVVKVISYLSRSFEQVFIVSHTDEIKDVIDSSIIIERDEDKSTVRLTNG